VFSSDDDYFAIFAALQLGQNSYLVSNDRFTNITQHLKEHTDVAELFNIWTKNQIVGHRLPLEVEVNFDI
jgi:hypothetical protein